MLSNYGLGRVRPYQLDILTMTLMNSQERQLQELISLTLVIFFSSVGIALQNTIHRKQAGFKYEKVLECDETKILQFSANWNRPVVSRSKQEKRVSVENVKIRWGKKACGYKKFVDTRINHAYWGWWSDFSRPPTDAARVTLFFLAVLTADARRSRL